MYLTPDQLKDLTGLTQGAAQIRWLKANRLQYWVRVDGKPRVPADEYGAPIPIAPETQESGAIQPDFGALRAAR